MTTTEPLGDAPAELDGRAPERWRRRPITAALLRLVIVLAPLALAAVAGLAAGWAIAGHGFGSLVARVVVAGAVSILTFAGCERLARRLLPLTTLLKLSLVFPDRGPSRFAVALRSTSVHKLQQWARTAQHDDGVAALAEKVVTLATALNTHDRRTRGHSERSRAMAELIAVEMGLPEPEVNEVRWGAFLHDIGKILVPATLLNKPGAPTPHEWKTLRRHPAHGGDLVEPLRLFLGSGVEAVSGHHENYDGSGYPHGLAGDDIALAARIVHVADSFEVMTAVRSYKRPMSATEARQELARHSGSQFDPDVVRALLNISLGRLHWSLGFAAWMAEIPFLTVIPRAAAQVGAAAAAPTMSMSALSGVAAISFGSIVAPATLAPAASVSAPTKSTQTVAPVYASAPVPAPTSAGGAGGPAVTGASAEPSTPAPAPESSGLSSPSASSPSTPAASPAAPDSTDVASTTGATPASTTTEKAAQSLTSTAIASTPPLVATAPTPIDTSSTPPIVATAPTPITTTTTTPPLVISAPAPIETTTTTTPTTKAGKKAKASKS